MRRSPILSRAPRTPRALAPRALLTLLAALLLAACGGDRAQSEPVTPADFVNFAAARTQSVDSYQLRFRSVVTAAGVRTPVEEQLEGEFIGQDAHYFYTSPANVELGLTEQDAIQVTIVDGTSYVFGPIPGWGAPKPRWYVFSTDPDVPVAAPTKLNLLIEALARRDLRLDFARARSEQIDGVSCDRYNADSGSIVAIVNELSQPAQPTRAVKTLFGTTPDSYFSVWTCADGYIRKIDADVRGPDENDQELGFRLQLDLTNLNKVAPLQAPADAIPAER